MNDRDRTTPTPDRAEDAELGFSATTADRLRAAMHAEADPVTAPHELWDEVTARRDRRRWTLVGGFSLVGVAAAAAVVVALVGVPSTPSIDPVPADPAESESEAPRPSPTPSQAPAPVPSSAAPADPDPAPSTATGDADGDDPTAAIVVIEAGTGATGIPRFELEGLDDGTLRLVERGADGSLVGTRDLVRDDAVAIGGVWVRPGSSPDDLTAVVAGDTPVEGRGRTVLSTLRVVDGESTLTPWADDLQPEALTGTEGDASANGGDWSPDGDAFAVSVQPSDPDSGGLAQHAVLTWGDTGPTLAGVEVTDGQGIVEWADLDDPETPGVEFDLWYHPLGDSGLGGSGWVLAPDGTATRGTELGASYDAPPPSTQPGFYQAGGAVLTPYGVLDSVSLVDMSAGADPDGAQRFVRLVEDGELLASLPLPPDVGFTTRARLTLASGEPVVALDTERATLLVRPTTEGEIADLVRLDAPPRTAVVDWVD